MKNTKRFTQIFKVFSNINRVKIVMLLSKRKVMNVTDIAEELDISFKSASKHLILLDQFDVVNSKGKSSHVFYSLNEDMSKDLKSVISTFSEG